MCWGPPPLRLTPLSANNAAFRVSTAFATSAISSAASAIARLRSLGDRVQNGFASRGRRFLSLTCSSPALASSRAATDREIDAAVVALTFADDRDLVVDDIVRPGRTRGHKQDENVAAADLRLDLRISVRATRHETVHRHFIFAALHAWAQKFQDEAQPTRLLRWIRLIAMRVADEDERLGRIGRHRESRSRQKPGCPVSRAWCRLQPVAHLS
jgi:hypothetical protein